MSNPDATEPLATPEPEQPLATSDAEQPLATPDTKHPLASSDAEQPLATPDTKHPLASSDAEQQSGQGGDSAASDAAPDAAPPLLPDADVLTTPIESLDFPPPSFYGYTEPAGTGWLYPAPYGATPEQWYPPAPDGTYGQPTQGQSSSAQDPFWAYPQNPYQPYSAPGSYHPYGAQDPYHPYGAQDPYHPYGAQNPYQPYGYQPAYPGDAPQARSSRTRHGRAVVIALLIGALSLVSLGWQNPNLVRWVTTSLLPSTSAQPSSGTTAGPTPSPRTSPAATVAPGALSRGVVLIEGALGNGTAAGTGMVLTASGEVLTNYHVVAGTSAVRVTIADSGATYSATVVGFDDTRDVALLQLRDASNLATVTLDNDVLHVGDPIVSVGNAQGQRVLQSAPGTVTGLNQPIDVTSESPWGGNESLTGLIRTNAGALPGDSGGPMFDNQGEVTGMTTAGSVERQQTYAVPIATAMSVVRQIEAGNETGTVQIGPSGYLGITADTTAQRTTAGITVTTVAAGSPAASAGLQAGDRMTSFNGTQITATTNVPQLIRHCQPGQKVAITWVDTSGATRSATVTLGTSQLN